jgi:hypothetical protein
MKLIFVDEVEQPQKAPGFFGIGAFCHGRWGKSRCSRWGK